MNVNSMTELTRFVVRNLDTQFMISLSQNPELSHRPQSPYALGYIYGFTCGGFSAFHAWRYEDQLDALIGVYEHVFEMSGCERLQQSIDLQGDADFRQGRGCGWEEMKRLLHRKETAIGLVRFLIDGEVTQTMVPHAGEEGTPMKTGVLPLPLFTS